MTLPTSPKPFIFNASAAERRYINVIDLYVFNISNLVSSAHALFPPIGKGLFHCQNGGIPGFLRHYGILAAFRPGTF